MIKQCTFLRGFWLISLCLRLCDQTFKTQKIRRGQWLIIICHSALLAGNCVERSNKNTYFHPPEWDGACDLWLQRQRLGKCVVTFNIFKTMKGGRGWGRERSSRRWNPESQKMLVAGVFSVNWSDALWQFMPAVETPAGDGSKTQRQSRWLQTSHSYCFF